MNKKIGGLLLLSVIALNAIMPVIEAEAVDTKATTEFKEPGPTDPVDPVDPEDPNPDPIDPVDPDDPEPPIYPGGPLRLNHVPTISFGVNDISASTATYNGKLERVYDLETSKPTDRPSFVEVADLTGQFKGWTVKASSDGVFKSSKNSIFGSVALKDGNVRGLNGMDELKDKFPVANQEVVLGQGLPAAEVIKATSGKGYNKWQVRYGASTVTVKGDDGTDRNPKVTLKIPQGQEVHAEQLYVAKIVWTLEQGL